MRWGITLTVELDEFQSQLLNDPYQPNKLVILQACPGSGKTFTILHKIRDLVTTNELKADEIVAIAFGNKAARELKIRYSKLKKHSNEKNVFCSTIHSLSNYFLRNTMGIKRTVLTEWKSLKLLRDCMEDLGYFPDGTKKTIMTSAAKEIYDNYTKNRTWLSTAIPKSEYLDGDDVKKALDRYTKQKVKLNVMDYTDMIELTVDAMENDTEICNKIRNTFKAWFIDEAQDLDRLQYKFIRLATSQNTYTVMVGDVMQTLYLFRGAAPELFSKHSQDKYYETVIELQLRKNYRSTANIVRLSNIIRNNLFTGYPMVSVPNKETVGGSVKISTVRSNIQEGTKAAKSIKEFVDNGGSYKDIAIICRSNSYIRSTIEPALIRENIPYRLMSSRYKTRFSENDPTQIYKTILSIIVNPDDYYSLFELATFIKGVGNATLEKIEKAYRQNQNQPNLSGKSLEIFNDIMSMKREIMKLKVFTEPSEIAEMLTFIDIICRTYLNYEAYFPSERETAILQNAIAFWVKHFSEEGAINMQDAIEGIVNEIDEFDIDEDEDSVKIHTVHSSKGLEFPYTIVCGFNTPKAMDEFDDSYYILYVQLSRAIDKLLIIDSVEYHTKDNKIITPSKTKAFNKLLKAIS